jgi:hypothetical protein
VCDIDDYCGDRAPTDQPIHAASASIRRQPDKKDTEIARPRRSSPIAAVAAAMLLTLVVCASHAQAATYKKCMLSESQQQPAGGVPTYNFTLKQRHTTCATAAKVMRAFHTCRAKSGATCTKRLLSHWSCKGAKTSSLAVLFYAKFTCSYGARRVMSTFEQDV